LRLPKIEVRSLGNMRRVRDARNRAPLF